MRLGLATAVMAIALALSMRAEASTGVFCRHQDDVLKLDFHAPLGGETREVLRAGGTVTASWQDAPPALGRFEIRDTSLSAFSFDGRLLRFKIVHAAGPPSAELTLSIVAERVSEDVYEGTYELSAAWQVAGEPPRVHSASGRMTCGSG